MRYAQVLVAALIALPGAVHGQNAAQWAAWGDAAAARGDHYGASRFYARSLELDPGRMVVQWSCAEACRLSHQYDKAAPLYAQVQRKDMGRTHPDALRWLGEMQLSLGRYEEARETWQRVLQREKRKDSAVAQRARNAMEGCRMAKEWLARPDTVEITHLPQPVNSYDSEFGARMGADSTLYFSALRGELTDEGEVKDTAAYQVSIYRSSRLNGQWSAPEMLPAPVNTEGDNANAIWRTDGRLLFTRRDTSGHRRILEAEVQDDRFMAVHALPLEGSVSQPAPAQIEGSDCLFYTRWDLPGDQADILCSCPGNSDLESRLGMALSKVVNGPGNETGPWFDATSGRLWFSSDHLPGLGGFDLFTCLWGPEGFSAPINAGHPLNSPANDLYPTYDGAAKRGSFTSNRVGSLAKKGENCCNDLYMFNYPRPPEVVVVEVPVPEPVALKHITSLREKLPVRLYFHNDEPEPRTTSTRTAQTYTQTFTAYKARVPEYHKAWEGENEDTDDIDAFFRDQVDGGHARLGDFVALLRQALDEGQSIRLVVRGFASPLAKSDYNVNLSLRRIQSLVNELRVYERGALAPYLDALAPNGGRLVIEPAPYGESRSLTGVSDVLDDLRGSVYSVAASRERRIEIEQIEVLPAAPEAGQVRLEQDRMDLGRLVQGEPRSVEFILRNDRDKPLTLLATRADCGCTTATVADTVIPPGGRTTVTVEFNGRAPEGALTKTVVLITDGEPSEVVLTISGHVEPHP